jgi:type I restriction enzyme S subunit
MKTPELRFTDKSGKIFPDWQIKCLGEISSIKRGASPRPISDKKWFSDESNIGWVRISDVTSSSKYLNTTEQFLSEEGVNRSRLVTKGNIIMSICATIGKPIYTNLDACIHDGFVVFEDLQIDHEYLYYYLSRIEKNWYRYGQPGSQVNLNSDIVSNESIAIPNIEEQKKIAAFLSSIDKKISLLLQKHQKLEDYKKGAMQSFFNREMRFKNNRNEPYPEWQSALIGDLFSDLKGATLSKDSIVENGANKCILYGELFTKYSEQITEVQSRTDSTGGIPSVAGDLLMPASTTTSAIDLAKASAILENNVLLGGDIIVLRPKKPCNSKYMAYYLTHGLKTELAKNAQGITIIHMYFSKIKDIQLCIPSIEEQNHIANFLSAIDEKILNSLKQLELTKQYRQGLLQQMFV